MGGGGGGGGGGAWWSAAGYFRPLVAECKLMMQ